MGFFQTGGTAPIDTVISASIQDGAVALVDMAPDSVNQSKLTDGAVGTAELLDNAVTTAKIAALQVTTAKIAAGAVTTTEIGALQVTTAKIAAGAVTTAELGDLAVTTGKIGALQVTTAKIAAEAVTTAELGPLAVTAAKLANNVVSASGTYALRPAANTVSPGSFYYATNYRGGQLFRSNGTAWAAIGAPSWVGNGLAGHPAGMVPNAARTGMVGMGALAGATIVTSGTQSAETTAATGFLTGAVAGNTGGFHYLTSLYYNLATEGAFTCHARFGSITAVRDWVGVFSASPFTRDSLVAGVISGIGFRFSTAAADTTWKFVVSDGTTETVIDTGVTHVASNNYRFTAWGSGASGTISWTLEVFTLASGLYTLTSTASGTTAQLIASITKYGSGFVGVETLAAAAKAVTVNGFYSESWLPMTAGI